MIRFDVTHVQTGRFDVSLHKINLQDVQTATTEGKLKLLTFAIDNAIGVPNAILSSLNLV